MARQPIILESNLIQDGFGALPSNYYGSGDAGSGVGTVQNEDGTYTIPTYQIESNTPTFDLSEMQNIYGTEYMPMFNWINQSQTGSYVYDPKEDTKEIDALKEKFEIEQGIAAEEALAKRKAMYKAEAIGAGQQIASGIGAQVGRAYAGLGDAATIPAAFGEYGKGSAMEILGYGKTDSGELTAKVTNSPQFEQRQAQINLASQKSPAGRAATEALKGNAENPLSADASTKYLDSIKNDSNLDQAGKELAANEYKSAMTAIPAAPTSIFANRADRAYIGIFDGKMSAAGKANLYGAGGAGAATLAYSLIAGKNLKESVKSAAKVSVGTFVGTALGGGFGGLIGGILGGRVICNELQRQGIMTRKQVVLDYKFTRDYLTPTHVNGYHVWAVWMVKQMRQGRLVNFWKHVAGHRANEIAYIYGERAKPDYLGKVYRKILEPICWSIGFFCKTTDWSVLYTQKEV